MENRYQRLLLVVIAALICAARPASAQFTQQGAKLVGTGTVGIGAEQGISVGLSGDGNTAIVGGPFDNNDTGAAWVFTRSGGVWTQHGPKLVGSNFTGDVSQGYAVALSSDGNTAIVGGPFDNPTCNVNCFGGIGAAWVFTQSAGVWTQQAKLVGSSAIGSSVYQGQSVALSADGNTAIVGGYYDNTGTGAAWVYTRSGGVWTQQAKLVGSGAVGLAQQGWSVSLSGDGNTAIVGGPFDNAAIGAAWVFTRSGGVWSQLGSKLIGSGAIGPPVYQGQSVALSANGNAAIVGGYGDNANGAAWVFTLSGGVWTQQGSKLVGSGGTARPRFWADLTTTYVTTDAARQWERRGSSRRAPAASGLRRAPS